MFWVFGEVKMCQNGNKNYHFSNYFFIYENVLTEVRKLVCEAYFESASILWTSKLIFVDGFLSKLRILAKFSELKLFKKLCFFTQLPTWNNLEMFIWKFECIYFPVRKGLILINLFMKAKVFKNLSKNTKRSL